MHRSRLSVLAIFAAAAACSTHDDADATSILSKDTALVATLEARESPRQQPLPDACGTVAYAPRPSAANRAQAEQLAREGYDAELLGRTREAQSLLSRASTLDGTDKSAAYHLARTSEALGDRAGAMTAYCRYLTLAPTTSESAEARQRLAALTEPATRVVAVSVGGSAPVQRVAATTPRRTTHASRGAERRGAGRRAVEQGVRTAPSDRVTYSSGIIAPASDDARMQSDAPNGATDADGRTAASGEMTAASRPTVDQAPAPRTETRGPSRVQTAGIGAIAGAIMGAAAGRSVKSAVIGAAAGGVLGTVVGRR